MASDQICLDENWDICLDDFEFLNAQDFDYPKVQQTEVGGVISFN